MISACSYGFSVSPSACRNFDRSNSFSSSARGVYVLIASCCPAASIVFCCSASSSVSWATLMAFKRSRNFASRCAFVVSGGAVEDPARSAASSPGVEGIRPPPPLGVRGAFIIPPTSGPSSGLAQHDIPRQLLLSLRKEPDAAIANMHHRERPGIFTPPMLRGGPALGGQSCQNATV